jgi:hypothetical protein
MVGRGPRCRNDRLSRPKTGIPRWCVLRPENVEELRQESAVRPKSKDEVDTGMVVLVVCIWSAIVGVFFKMAYKRFSKTDTRTI